MLTAGHWGCRVLAVLAWVAATAWFLLSWALTWGFIPIAMGLWSVVALPVAGFTLLWLKKLGRPVPLRKERWAKLVWLALLLLLLPLIWAGDHRIWDHQWVEWGVMAAFPVYLLFPALVTGWALVSIVRARAVSPPSGLTNA
jgi:hypothetical protein